MLSLGTIRYSECRHDCFVDLSRDIIHSLNGGVPVSVMVDVV